MLYWPASVTTVHTAAAPVTIVNRPARLRVFCRMMISDCELSTTEEAEDTKDNSINREIALCPLCPPRWSASPQNTFSRMSYFPDGSVNAHISAGRDGALTSTMRYCLPFNI